jgi:L-2-hydroxyglutarate oxidase LhgO
LAFAREGYTLKDVNPRDLLETVSYNGFRTLALRYWRTGVGELWRSFSKAAFVRSLQRLVPEVRREHLVAAPAGVRAQAVTSDGELHSDFVVTQRGAIVNVCNAPSPAATSALSIGQTITRQVQPFLNVQLATTTRKKEGTRRHR